LQEVKELSKQMSALREDKKNPIQQVIDTLEAYYGTAPDQWTDSLLTEEQFFETAKQTALLFEHIYEREKVQDQQVLLFLGPTGTGKSTTIGILLGAVLKVLSLPTGEADEYGEPKMRTAYVLEGQARHLVSNGASKSCTIIPKSMGQVVEIAGWTIWDFPGFEDTRSKAFNIGIAAGYKALIKRAKRCCLVSCCGPASISGTNMVEKTGFALKAIVPAPAPVRSSKCFVSLNYNVDGFHLTHHDKLTAKLDAEKIAYFKMDLDALLKGKPVRSKYIEKLTDFLKKDQSAMDPKDMDHYTKTMDEQDVTQYDRCLEQRIVDDSVFVEAVLEFVGLKALANSYKALSESQDCGFADIAKHVKDFGELEKVCKTLLDSFSTASADFEDKLKLLKDNLSLKHLETLHKERLNVWANERKIDSTLCDIVKSRDIELARPINEKEFQTVLVTVEKELNCTLEKLLDQSIKMFTGDIRGLVSAVKDEALTAHYECLAGELRAMKETVEIKQAAEVTITSWSSTKKGVDCVSTLLMSVGLALETVPAVGQVVGTGMILAGGVMKAVAGLATMFVAEKEKQEKKQHGSSIQLLKDLGLVVVKHCRQLSNARTVVEGARALKTQMSKDMNSQKAEVNNVIMNIT